MGHCIASPAAPPVLLLLQDFDLSCTPLEFWSRFLANHSDFLHRFHASRGDTNIHLSKWQRHFKASGSVKSKRWLVRQQAGWLRPDSCERLCSNAALQWHRMLGCGVAAASLGDVPAYAMPPLPTQCVAMHSTLRPIYPSYS
jgi:hypothetical protein